MAKHWLLLAVAACGGGDKMGPKTGPKTGPEMGPKMGKMDAAMLSNKQMPPDEASKFGALEAGADWSTYTKVNKASFKSETHGGRLVDTYVNPIGLDAFKKGEDMPAGSIVVKTSKDADDGSEGPLFVMEKRETKWWYAIHWASPPAAWQNKLGGPIYWRSPSPKADYCVKCHDDFVNGLGGVPDDQRAW